MPRSTIPRLNLHIVMQSKMQVFTTLTHGPFQWLQFQYFPPSLRKYFPSSKYLVHSYWRKENQQNKHVQSLEEPHLIPFFKILPFHMTMLKILRKKNKQTKNHTKILLDLKLALKFIWDLTGIQLQGNAGACFTLRITTIPFLDHCGYAFNLMWTQHFLPWLLMK